MHYIEMNMINQLHVRPFGSRIITGCCPREEIADPEKLYRFVNGIRMSWDIFNYNDQPYYRAYIPWMKKWNFKGDIIVNSVGLYVLTECPSMFRSMKKIIADPNVTHLSEWLRDWWHVPFIISSPVYGKREANQIIPVPFFINNRYMSQTIPLHGDDDALTQMLGAEGYTICNGLTLFLAMARLEEIPEHECFEALQELTQVVDMTPEMISPIPVTWTHFYLAHTTPHVSDHPWIYARMGDQPAYNSICNLLSLLEDGFVLQFGHNDVGSITSLGSSLLPYRPYEMYWPVPPLSLEDEDTYRPDICSFVLGVVRTRKSWKWWMDHGSKYIIRRTCCFFPKMEDALHAWLSVLSNFYECAKEHTPRLPYSRIRTLWLQVMKTIDPQCVLMPKLLRRIMIKEYVTEELSNRGYLVLHQTIHFSFNLLKDIFELYKDDLQLWKNEVAHVYSGAFASNILIQVFPDGEITVDGGVKIRQNLFHYFKHAHATTVFGDFYRSYIQKRIASRVWGIVNGFGMKENCDPSIPMMHHHDYHQYNMSLIGFLLLEHMREKKENLVF